MYMDGWENGTTWVWDDHRSGTVIEFDEAQSYGFIIEDGNGEEVFVNRHAIKHQGIDPLPLGRFIFRGCHGSVDQPNSP